MIGGAQSALRWAATIVGVLAVSWIASFVVGWLTGSDHMAGYASGVLVMLTVEWLAERPGRAA